MVMGFFQNFTAGWMLGMVTDQVSDQDTDQDHIRKEILLFCSIPRSAREILNHIGYAYNSTNIANQIKPLLHLGFLEMTEPDKPNSKNQKYRKAR